MVQNVHDKTYRFLLGDKIVIKERNKGNIEKIQRLLKCVFVDIMSKREIKELIKEIRKESEEKKMLSLGQRIVIQMRKEGKAEGKAEGKIEGIMYNIPINVDTIKEGYPILCA